MVGQADPKIRGKISRSLAAKCAICVRSDALVEGDKTIDIGNKCREAIEARLATLEKQHFGGKKGEGEGKNIKKYDSGDFKKKSRFNEAEDVQLGDAKLTGKKRRKSSA